VLAGTLLFSKERNSLHNPFFHYTCLEGRNASFHTTTTKTFVQTFTFALTVTSPECNLSISYAHVMLFGFFLIILLYWLQSGQIAGFFVKVPRHAGWLWGLLQASTALRPFTPAVKPNELRRPRTTCITTLRSNPHKSSVQTF